jgi:hypothetical protein
MEAIRFKPQSESRFVSNPIAPGVGQINSGILTLSGSIHSRNLTITSIHKVGQTIPGIPGSDDSRNKWVRLFPEYMGELIPGIGGSEVSGIFKPVDRHGLSTSDDHCARADFIFLFDLSGRPNQIN